MNDALAPTTCCCCKRSGIQHIHRHHHHYINILFVFVDYYYGQHDCDDIARSTESTGGRWIYSYLFVYTFRFSSLAPSTDAVLLDWVLWAIGHVRHAYGILAFPQYVRTRNNNNWFV